MKIRWQKSDMKRRWHQYFEHLLNVGKGKGAGSVDSRVEGVDENGDRSESRG